MRVAFDRGEGPVVASQAWWLRRWVIRLEEHRGVIQAVQDGEIAGQILKDWDHLIALKTLWAPRGEAIDVEQALRDPRRSEAGLHRIFLHGAVVGLRSGGRGGPRERVCGCDESPYDIRQRAEKVVLEVGLKLWRRM